MARVEVKNTAGRRIAEKLYSARWYAGDCDGEENANMRAQRVMTYAEHLWQKLEPMRVMWAVCARNYGDSIGIGLGTRGYRQASVQGGQRLSLNLSKSVSDSYVALVTEDIPKVTFLTNDGSWELQQRAENLEKFVDGVVYDQELDEKDVLYQGDVAKYGTAWEFYSECEEDPKGPRILCTRVPPWCVLIDETETQIGRLRNPCRIEFIDRQDLLDTVKEGPDAETKRAAIKTASSTAFDLGANASGQTEADTQDLVAVVWAWHLPRTSESGDGRWVKVLGSVVLDQGEYTDLDFPFESLYRLPPGEGIWGSSLVEELRPIQRAVNTLTRMIDRSHHLLSAGHWLVPNGAHINTNQMDNQIGSIIRHDPGMAPQFVAVQAIGADVYQERDRLFQYAFEIIGISPMAAQSQIPAGIKSGRAMRVYTDVQSKRFKPAYQQYQGFKLRRAKQIIKFANKIASKHPNYEIKSAGEDVVSAIKWADAGMKESEFVLKLYPTNSLADDPAERIEQVQEIQGLPPDMKRLLNFPDLKAEDSYDQASYKMTMKCITAIIRGDKYVGPRIYMDLDNAIKRVELARVKAEFDGVPDDRLRLLETWIQQAVELRESPEWAAMNPTPANPLQALPQGTQMAPGGMMPPGAPGMPPPPGGGPPMPNGAPPPPMPNV